MNNIFCLIPILVCSLATAQPPNLGDSQEVQETLRFIRLAESKKKLALSEQKLLAVNELFDAFEETTLARKREMRREYFQLRRGIKDGTADVSGVDAIIEKRVAEVVAQEKLWVDLKALLSPEEATRAFLFYENFQREMQRKARMMQRERRGNQGNQGKRPRRNQ